jgi:capsid protein
LSFGAQQTFLNERLNDQVCAWFMTAAFAAGLTPPMAGYGFDPLPWHEAHTWQNPGWAWVDPYKDSVAVDKGIDNVTTTRRRAAAQKGDDWDEIVEEAMREEEKLSELYRLRAANQKLLENTP